MELGRTDFHLRRVARAREREETPNWSPQNMWCFSVVFHVATCEFEIAKTGRRSISKDGTGRSHQDLAIRKLGNRVNPAFAQNTAVADGNQNATHKSRTGSIVAWAGGRGMRKHRCAPLGGMVLQDLGEI